MKSYKAIIAIVFIVVLSALALLSPRSGEKSNNQLVVGMMSGWAPFMSINAMGEYEGFDVDVAKDIAKRMNKDLVIQDLGSLASCFVALEQGKIDMVMSDLDITKKRQEILNMVYYTGDDVTEYSLLFWENIPQSIRAIEDLRSFSNAVVCVESGSSQEKFIDNYDFITKKRMNTVIDILLDLRFSKSLSAVLEPRIAARLKKQNPELQILPVVLPADFQVFGCGIAIKKDNEQLTQEVTAAVLNMIQDGIIKQQEITWGLE